jgi:lysophospholipid acyltransferase (LPLAT)-like uncharacterized protein
MVKGPIAQAILAEVLWRYLAFALATTRWTVVGQENLAPFVTDRAGVVGWWHERLPLMPQLWRIAQRSGAPMGMRVLVSQHRDGRLIGTVIERFGVRLIYGSSSRRGASGLRACAAAIAAGDHVGITPDGPRGPRRVAARGIAQLAALSGAPVLPTSAQTTRRMTLKSWDRMVVPLPFGRGVIVCGPAIAVARADWQGRVAQIEAALNAAADEADRLCHVRA